MVFVRHSVKGFLIGWKSRRQMLSVFRKPRRKFISLIQRSLSPPDITAFTMMQKNPVTVGPPCSADKSRKELLGRLAGTPVDSEGRYLQADFDGLSVISLYVPSGSSGEVAQARKEVFMENFFEHLRALRKKRREFIICADWNICHKEIDLKNWRGNRKNSGFLPHERAWLDRVFNELGWIDIFRQVRPEPDLYTWWSNRGQAWAKNVGWRLDYMLTTPRLSGSAVTASIYREERFSDHAPLTIDFKR